MTKCQVSGCQEIALYRCESGFYYCGKHKSHNHSDFKNSKRATLKSVYPSGEYLYPKQRFK